MVVRGQISRKPQGGGGGERTRVVFVARNHCTSTRVGSPRPEASTPSIGADIGSSGARGGSDSNLLAGREKPKRKKGRAVETWKFAGGVACCTAFVSTHAQLQQANALAERARLLDPESPEACCEMCTVSLLACYSPFFVHTFKGSGKKTPAAKY